MRPERRNRNSAETEHRPRHALSCPTGPFSAQATRVPRPPSAPRARPAPDGRPGGAILSLDTRRPRTALGGQPGGQTPTRPRRATHVLLSTALARGTRCHPRGAVPASHPRQLPKLKGHRRRRLPGRGAWLSRCPRRVRARPGLRRPSARGPHPAPARGALAHVCGKRGTASPVTMAGGQGTGDECPAR